MYFLSIQIFMNSVLIYAKENQKVSCLDTALVCY